MVRLTEKIINKNTGDIIGHRVRNGVSYIRAFNKLGILEDIEEKDRIYGWFTSVPEDGTTFLATVYHRPWISDMGTEDEIRHEERYEVCQVWRRGGMYIKMDDTEPGSTSYIPLEKQEKDMEYPIEEVIAWIPLPISYSASGIMRTNVQNYVKIKSK